MPEAATYAPLDRPKPVDADLWTVDAEPMHPLGVTLPLRMTVIRLGNGDLLLYSPTRHTPELQHALGEIGLIRHLVAPNVAHWMFLRDWQRTCPGATTWGAPGLGRRRQVRAAGVRVDIDLGPVAPDAWRGEIDQVLVASGPFSEVALFHRASRTLLVADLLDNVEGGSMTPLPRALAALAGILAPDGHAPLQVRLVLALNGAAVARAARQILAFTPRRVVMAHGTPFKENAAERLRASLAPLLRGAQTQRAVYGAAAAVLLIATGWAAARRRR